MHVGVQQLFAFLLVIVCPARYRLINGFKALPQITIDAAEAVDEYFRRADIPQTGRGDAAAATETGARASCT